MPCVSAVASSLAAGPSSVVPLSNDCPHLLLPVPNYEVSALEVVSLSFGIFLGTFGWQAADLQAG